MINQHTLTGDKVERTRSAAPDDNQPVCHICKQPRQLLVLHLRVKSKERSAIVPTRVCYDCRELIRRGNLGRIDVRVGDRMYAQAEVRIG